jgi:hypothetical protein
MASVILPVALKQRPQRNLLAGRIFSHAPTAGIKIALVDNDGKVTFVKLESLRGSLRIQAAETK